MAINPTELAFLCEFVHRRSAIVLGSDKEYLIEARLAPLARAEGFTSIDALIARLRTGPPSPLQTKVIEAMTTHETTFFRDTHPFDALKQELIPTFRKARAAVRALTVMSAACSSGQEPYSIAMLLRESFPDMASWSTRIIATDLSHAVLARAKAAKFHPSEIGRGLPDTLRAKYFDQTGTEWQLKACVRDMVEFRQMNLMEAWAGMPRVDVLFLRNVLIYFDVPTKRAILGHARQVLAPDGYMILGGAETTMKIDESFKRVQIGKAIFYQPGTSRAA